MDKHALISTAYKRILLQEIVAAMGCTEPIAIAYAAAKMREVLGSEPEKVKVVVSNNIIKNVKSVTIPNTDGMTGIQAAAAAGIVAGTASKELQVLSEISNNDNEAIRKYMETHCIEVLPSKSNEVFEIEISGETGRDTAQVRIVKEHTNVVRVVKNKEILFEKKEEYHDTYGDKDYSLLCVDDIIEFAAEGDINGIEDIIWKQAEYNLRIAEEGLQKDYGARIGKTLLAYKGSNIYGKAEAMAAAGSDARMAGCELPVMIVGGSGNQGIAASVPIIAFAMEGEYDKQRIVRTLILSDLLSIYQRFLIGRLSAYCGAVNAGSAAAAAIAYLEGGSKEQIKRTLVNGLAIASGIICDGAKASCAAKVAASVEAGLLGYQMSMRGLEFKTGEGIVAETAEETVQNIGRLGKEGMKETDNEIIAIMLGARNN